MKRILFPVGALALVSLASCIPSPEAPRPAQPTPVPTRAPPPPPPAPAPLAADWRDWPLTPGDWRYAMSGVVSSATYGSDPSAFTISCDRAAHQVRLLSAQAAGGMTIRTTSLSRSLNGALAPNDQLLDAIAYSRGRFLVEQPGQPPLVIPAYAEIARVIEDCRS